MGNVKEAKKTKIPPYKPKINFSTEILIVNLNLMVLMNGGIKDMAKNKQNDALFLKAEKLLEEGFEEKAFKCYKKCAKQGNYNCQHNLAYFYDKGIGVEENPTKAIFWYKKSYSNNPILPSANNLALIYLEQGKYLKALKWFIRAIECHKKQNKKQK